MAYRFVEVVVGSGIFEEALDSAKVGIRDGVEGNTVCSLIETLGGTVDVGQGMTVGVSWCRFHSGLEERGIVGKIIGILVGESVCNPVGHSESSIVGHSVRRFVDISPGKLERI